MTPALRTVAVVCLVALASGLAVANTAHDTLLKLPTAKRNATLSRFMEASDERCKVIESFFQGFDKTGMAFWSVRCSNAKSFSVSIENDAGGSTKILECSVLKFVSGVECFKKFDEQDAR